MAENSVTIPEVNLYTYIASKRNPQKQDRSIRYIISKGYSSPRNRFELARFLHDYVTRSQDPDKALRDMVKEIHPDKELFTIIELPQPKEEPKKNFDACGCSAMSAEGGYGCPLEKMNADAKTVAPVAKPIISEKLANTLIISGVALLGISILVTVGVSIAKSRK